MYRMECVWWSDCKKGPFLIDLHRRLIDLSQFGAYYPKQDPSGSSSGSGVSASIGLSLACLGTEVRVYEKLLQLSLSTI